MINLKALDTSAFDYFPTNIIAKEAVKQGILEEYHQHKETLHSDRLCNLSLIDVGMIVIVRYSNELGTITNWHQSDAGKMNGGVEVDFKSHKDYFYPHQLKRFL